MRPEVVAVWVVGLRVTSWASNVRIMPGVYTSPTLASGWFSKRVQRKGEVIMRFRMLLATVIATALAGGVAAQTDKHVHEHGSVKAAESKAAADIKPQITAKDLKQRLDKGEKITIIDARHDLGGQILKGAIHVSMDKLEEWAKDVDKNSVIVTYCTCPHDEAADAEVQTLQKMGFKNAYALAGGLDAARSAGFEVVTPADK